MLIVLSALAALVAVGVAIDMVILARRRRIPERVRGGQDPTTTREIIVDLNRRS